MHPLALSFAGFATAAVGTIGGLGGAVLLVPALVLAGVAPQDAIPLGLLAVAAGSLAAAATQIDEGLVNHRLGVVVESLASAGAVFGALAAAVLSTAALQRTLGVVAVVAGVATALRREASELAGETGRGVETPGELPGALAGTFVDDGAIASYRVRGLASGLAGMVVVGILAGVSGASGGFAKTPLMVSVMGVPAKVAGATTTFTVGITASAALLVFALGGRMDVVGGAAVVAGALAGGMVGSRAQSRMPTRAVGVALAVALFATGIALLVSS